MDGLRGDREHVESLATAARESLHLTPHDALPLDVGHNTSLDIAKKEPFRNVNVWCSGLITDGAKTALAFLQ